MLRHNNWMTYSYNNVIKGKKSHKADRLTIHIKPDINLLPISYTEAIFNNARQIQDDFNQTQDVLLSGGIDSEIIVRVNKKLGIKQNLYTFRLEDDINFKDVEYAIKLAESLNLKLNVIDFNAKKFVETKAEDLYKKTYMSLPYLIRTEWFNYLDNLPIMGNAEQYWKRELGLDYSNKSKWYYNWIEAEFSFSFWSDITQRPIIGEWYLYTPELFYNYHKTDVIKSLINDEVKGKSSSWSSRHLLFKEIWPDLYYKQKLTGYEGHGTPGSRPDFITEFENSVMDGFKNTDINIYEDQFNQLTFTSNL